MLPGGKGRKQGRSERFNRQSLRGEMGVAEGGAPRERKTGGKVEEWSGSATVGLRFV